MKHANISKMIGYKFEIKYQEMDSKVVSIYTTDYVLSLLDYV